MLSGSDRQVIDWAKILLQETDLTLRDIALKLRYNETEAFVNQFRRAVGVPPTQYRNGTIARRRAVRQNVTQPDKIHELVVEFAPDSMEREIWLHDGFVDIRHDVQDMIVHELRICPLVGDMVRIRALRRREFKSAMRRVDAEASFSGKGLKTNIRLSLIKLSSTLEVAYQGLGCIRSLEARITLRTTGPSY